MTVVDVVGEAGCAVLACDFSLLFLAPMTMRAMVTMMMTVMMVMMTMTKGRGGGRGVG